MRGVMDDSGVAEEIVFGTLKTHDMELCREMLKNTSCFHENDILINDRGFLSREMTNYLKTGRKVDAYIPSRENMDIFKDAVSLAVSSGKWQKHPDKKRKDQKIPATFSSRYTKTLKKGRLTQEGHCLLLPKTTKKQNQKK